MSRDWQTASDDDLALDLGGILREIGRALKWLLPLTLIVAAGVLVALLFVAPKYKGEARILIESADGNFPGGSRGIEEERALLDSEGVASQVQLLMSSDLARRVAQKLELSAVPEFDARAGGSLTDSLMTLLGLKSSPSGNSVEERVLQHYFENLDIYRLDGSRVIAIDYASENPVLAAKVSNAIVDEYLMLQSNAKRETTELASAALQPQIVELRKEVQAARQAVADFRARADLLIGADNIPLNQQQLAETSSDYSAAQAAKAEAQAKSDLIRDLLNSGGSLDTASDVLNSTLIQRLRERQVEIQSNIAELSITLLPSHPQLRALQSQLGDYDRQIRTEARKVLQGLENDAKVASQQALALSNRLEELKKSAAKSNADQARLSELEREANAKAVQLDQLLLSFQEADTRLRAQVLPADARIISRASVPVEPFSPKVIAGTIVAALVTFILGTAFVLMRAFLSGNALYRVHGDRESEAYDEPPVQRRGRAASSGREQAPAFIDGQPDRQVGASNMFGMNPGYQSPVANYRMETSFGKNNFAESFLTSDAQDDYVPSGPSYRSAAQERYESESQRRGALDPGEDVLLNEDVHDRSMPIGGRGFDRNRQPPLDQTVAPERPVQAAQQASEVLNAQDIEVSGHIVVLSVDDEALSHDLAFELVRKAAGRNKSAVVLEVFPEQSDMKAAQGFSDIVAGQAAFAKVVYRDAASKAHIIEAGRFEISDDMVNSERFALALEAISQTYEVVVVDLGAIDGTLASARMLSFADRVLIAASSSESQHELESAANLLAYNTGANVELVIPNGNGPQPQRNGGGHAA